MLRNNIGMMFYFSDNNFIVFFNICIIIVMCYKVNWCSCFVCENDFFKIFCINKMMNGFMGIFIIISC